LCLTRVQAWRQRAEACAVELERPGWSRELGQRPATVKGGRVWDRSVEQTVEYRQRWDVEDAEHPLGVESHGTDVSLRSGARGGMPPGRLVASGSWPATGPAEATSGRQPVVAITEATMSRRPVVATTEASGGDHWTASATASARCSWCSCGY